MTQDYTHKANEVSQDLDIQDFALMTSLSRLLVPLTRLCLAGGVTFAAVEEVLKRAFVQEAEDLKPGEPAHGKVSRISTATGINRREVTRLIKDKAPALPVKPPLATEIFARWSTDPTWRDKEGIPRVLNRQGTSPSFEALAQSITRDIHPRSMLDELVRLGLVQHDQELDAVSLTRSDFVPRCDSRQMLCFLGENVGDHLDAAVDNVMHDGSKHLEQAVFADELSLESIKSLHPLVMAQWQALRDAMVPTISALIEADQRAGRVQDQRVRIGLYTFTETAVDNNASNSSNSGLIKNENEKENF
jgi:hypothetical protein